MSIKQMVIDAMLLSASNMTMPEKLDVNPVWYMYTSNGEDVCIYGPFSKAMDFYREEQAMHAADALGVDFQQAKTSIDGQHINTWRQALEYCLSLRYEQ